MFRKSYRRLVRCPIFAEEFIERAERLVIDKAEDQARERGYASVEVTIEPEDVEDPQRLVVFVTFTAEEETRAPEWSKLTKEVMWAKKKWGEALAESPRMEEPKIEEEPKAARLEPDPQEPKPKAAPAPAEPEADDPVLDTDPVEEKDDDDCSTGLGGGGSAIEMPDTSDPVDTHEEPVEEPRKQSRAKELYDQIRQRRGIPPVEFVPAPAEPDRQAEEEEPEQEPPSSGKSGGVSTTNLIGLTLGTGLVCWSLWDILG